MYFQQFNIKRLWRSFIFNISMVILLTGSAVFTGIHYAGQNLVEESILERARAHFNDIVLTRKWNANYGGVYVEKRPGIESNPYLDDPDITTVDGKVYTLKNPALMTRELSELALTRGNYQFKITSLQLKNPNNRADRWEEESLKQFEVDKADEVYTRIQTGDQMIFRYMGPLYVRKPCLKCHGDQGYEIGDVRGGISVSMDITALDAELQRSRVITFILFILTVLSLLAVLYLFIGKLYRHLTRIQKQMAHLAIHDELTGLYNRRHFFSELKREVERALRYKIDLCCIMFDIDHFKMINDRYGHTGGDQVLRDVGEILLQNSRQADIVARYGGEEFIMLLPETPLEESTQVANKLLQAFRDSSIQLNDQKSIKIAASCGVALLSAVDIAFAEKRLIENADHALYQAKTAGRDRVVVADTDISQQP